MKYLISSYGEVILGNVGHAELRQATGDLSEIISAGHCAIKDGHIIVWGESATYGIPSRHEDAELIELTL